EGRVRGRGPMALRPRLATGLPLSRMKRQFVYCFAAGVAFLHAAGIRTRAKNLGRGKGPVKWTNPNSGIPGIFRTSARFAGLDLYCEQCGGRAWAGILGNRSWNSARRKAAGSTRSSAPTARPLLMFALLLPGLLFLLHFSSKTIH